MSYKDNHHRAFKAEKDLKEQLLQNLGENNVLGTSLGNSSGQYRSDIQDVADVSDHADSVILVDVNYPSKVSPDIKDLQFHMMSGCQAIAPQCQGDSDTQYPTLSHKQLVESLDRLSTPTSSQLTHTWVRRNRSQQMVGKYGQGQYDCHENIDRVCSNNTQGDVINWDDRLCPEECGEIVQQNLEDSLQQPVADVLDEIEHSLHQHIDAELDNLRVNLHSLVADQQGHFRCYLAAPTIEHAAPTQYSDDVEDIDIISNQDDISGPHTTMNLDDTDCMQSSCSTLNEPIKLEEASSDSAVGMLQDDMTCQQESLPVVNRIDRLTEDCEIQNVLLQLQTSAAVLSHTLKRQEYSTS